MKNPNKESCQSYWPLCPLGLGLDVSDRKYKNSNSLGKTSFFLPVIHENNLKADGLGPYMSLQSHEGPDIFLLPAALLSPALALPSWSKMATWARASVPSPARGRGGNQRAEKGCSWEATPCTRLPASQSPELYHMATPKGYPGLICWGGREGERSWETIVKCLLAVTAVTPQGSRSMLSAVLASLWPALCLFWPACETHSSLSLRCSKRTHFLAHE